jgi:transposase
MVMANSTGSKPPASRPLSLTAARQRRLQAARLFAQGLSQAEVARRLGVSRQTASRWHARWLKGGRAGLAGPGRWGRPSRLSDRDWQRVERALLAGPQAHGFDTDLWTLPRVAEVIWRTCGVGYHPGHVWWLLRRHHWSPQRPARRAVERDEAEVARWRAEEWPRIKGGRPSRARGSASSTSPAPR